MITNYISIKKGDTLYKQPLYDISFVHSRGLLIFHVEISRDINSHIYLISYS